MLAKIAPYIITLVVALGGLFYYAQPVYATTIKCSVLPDSICNKADEKNLGDSGIWRILTLVINVLSAGVGVVAVGMFVWAGYLYASSEGNANQISEAKKLMVSTTIGLVIYALMYALIQFIIPGGIFR